MAEIIYRECTNLLFPGESVYLILASHGSSRWSLSHLRRIFSEADSTCLFFGHCFSIPKTSLYIHSYAGVSSTQPMPGTRSSTV